MRNYIITALLVAFAGVFQACSENDIPVFNGKQQIYFNKFYMDAIAPGTETADSTLESFMTYPEGTTRIQAKVVVNISGVIPTEDIRFKLKAVEGTTAHDNEYELDEFYTFHKGKVTAESTDIRDTIGITLIYSDRLKGLGEQGTRLVVELVPNEQVELGQYERRRAVIVWTEFPAMPSWWDADTEIGTEVIYTLLGEYDAEKYILFLQHADTQNEMSEELITNNPSRAIELVNIFKKWLLDELSKPDLPTDDRTKYQEILGSLKV